MNKEELDFTESTITGTEFVDLINVVKSSVALKTLRVGKIEKLKVLIEAMNVKKTITTFGVQYNMILKEDIPSLMGLSFLEHLILDSNNLGKGDVIDLISKGLAESTSLQSISLKHNLINSQQAIELFKSLKENSSVKSINLSLNCIEKSAMAALVDLLQHNNHILEINISYNSIGEGLETFEGLRDCKFKKLDLSNCKISGSLQAFSEILQKGGTLEELNLSGNLNLKEKLCVVFDALRSNDSLKALRLSNVMLNKGMVESLCNALVKNRCLKVLDISNNILNTELIKLLGRMVRLNESLEEIKLNGIGLTKNAAKSLYFYLSGNVTITSIDLKNNLKLPASLLKFQKLVERNKSFKEKLHDSCRVLSVSRLLNHSELFSTLPPEIKQTILMKAFLESHLKEKELIRIFSFIGAEKQRPSSKKPFLDQVVKSPQAKRL